MNIIENFLQLNQNHRPQIAIIGDSVLDLYYNVNVSRINPESPTTIFQLKNNKATHVRLGGSGNVASQLKNFNCDVYLCSPLDVETKKLFDTDFSYCYELQNEEKIPRKKRYVCNDQVLQRIDIEDENYGSSNIKNIRKTQYKLFVNLIKSKKIDVVILSDYNKGLFDKTIANKIIKLCKSKNIITIVDPKKYLNWWKNCDIIKPNLKEALCLTKKKDTHTASSYIKNKLKCQYVIITQSNNPPLINNTSIENIPTNPAKSVIGAGDTYISFLALALAHNINIMDANYIAHYSGILYVQNCFNKPLYPINFYKTKIINAIDLQNRDFSLIATNGCFDIIHQSHINLFDYAKTLNDKLVVLINTDSSVQMNKGQNRPINNLNTRIKILESIKFIDYIVIFDEKTPYEVLKKIKANSLLKGGDYNLDQIVGKDLVEKTFIFPYENGNSTTNIIKKIKHSADIKE